MIRNTPLIQKIAVLIERYKKLPIAYRLCVACVAFSLFYVWSGENADITVRMPGATFSGTLPALNHEQERIKTGLYTHIEMLAEKIGERNIPHIAELNAARDYIKQVFQNLGYTVSLQTYIVDGQQVSNIIAEAKGVGNPEEILVLGAHYDSAHGTPGANDNGSGVAALLETAAQLVHVPLKRTVRFVAFVNEEPPYFQTNAMGSLVYAKQCKKDNDKIIGMISLETMGFFSSSEGSQHYPFPLNYFYPSKADFIGFIGNSSSAPLVTKTLSLFRKHTAFPSEGAAVPALFIGVGSSDHWAFWKQGYKALMITDTAFYRYPHYHQKTDRVSGLS